MITNSGPQYVSMEIKQFEEFEDIADCDRYTNPKVALSLVIFQTVEFKMEQISCYNRQPQTHMQTTLEEEQNFL